MSRRLLAALGAAVLMSGCSAGTAPRTTSTGGLKLATANFSGQLPTPCPFPSGTVGTAYSTFITATGGITPFRWDVATGSSLPPGLVIVSGTPSATISGTPQKTGTYSFILEVTDSELPPVTASAEFTLTVNPQPNPVPTVASISPLSATAGGAAFTLTVNGSSFVSGATVDWNGSARTTTFVSATQLTAAIPATDVATAGTFQVTVVNPSPGGGASNAVGFTVNNPAPAIASLSPSSALTYGAAFTLTVNGSNFVSGSTVDWDGSARATTFVSATQLTAAISATDINTAGTVQVTVVNPSPGGGTSNAVAFAVNNPVPAITSLSPPNAFVKSAAFTLTVNGSDFVSGATVDWNGSARTTNFVSPTQLTAAIPATDIAATGTANVTVVNPPPGGGTSQAATFTIRATFPMIASLATDGTQGDNSSGTGGNVSTSSDGRFVAFQSSASNFVAGDINQAADIFVRDTCQTFAAPVSGCTPSTTLVSVSTSGTVGNGTSYSPSISADGRFVAFVSGATDLVSGDTNGFDDVFVRDTCQSISGPVSGCTPSTTLVSVASNGTQADYYSESPSISANGRYVAFDSLASNLGAAATYQASEVYVHDTCQSSSGPVSGCTPSTTLVSEASDGTQANGSSYSASINADGRYIAFASYAFNLVANDTNGLPDVFVRDTCAGVASGCTPSTVRVSVASDGTEGTNPVGELGSDLPSISADGRYVAFESDFTNLVAGDTNQSADIFVRDTCAGATSACTPSTIRVSVASDGTQGDGSSFTPAISANGRFVAFESYATNLVSGDTNGMDDIFVRDTCAGVASGCTASTVRASVASDGTQANAGSYTPTISGDGHFVAFPSSASNLVPNDTNNFDDVFLALTSF